jgi:hypothetical protein
MKHVPSNLVGPPARGNDFYGRDQFVDLVWEKLGLGHVILAAPRRFGQTSVMYRLIDAPRWDYRLVHCDLDHFTEPADLLTSLVVQFSQDDALAGIASALSFVPSKVWKGFRDHVDEVEVHKLKIKLRESIRTNWQASGEELFGAVAGAKQTVVLILDEFAVMIDRMTRHPESLEDAKTLLRWLRHLRQSPETGNIRFLITGSIEIGPVLQRIGETASIDDCECLKLEPFSEKVADDFLYALAAAHEVPLPVVVRARILQLIGTRVPYFLQVMFSEIAKAFKQGGGAPTLASVDKIYVEKVLGVDCKTYFDHYYGRLRDYYGPEDERTAKAILRRLAEEVKVVHSSCYRIYQAHARGRDVDAFHGLMAYLENDFYIGFDPKTHEYEFSCKLLRDWWLRHYGMEV